MNYLITSLIKKNQVLIKVDPTGDGAITIICSEPMGEKLTEPLAQLGESNIHIEVSNFRINLFFSFSTLDPIDLALTLAEVYAGLDYQVRLLRADYRNGACYWVEVDIPEFES